METVVLGTDPAALSIGEFLQKVGPSGAEVRDAEGRVIGLVFPPENPLPPIPPNMESWEFGSTKKTSNERMKGKTTPELLAMLNAIPLPPDSSAS